MSRQPKNKTKDFYNYVVGDLIEELREPFLSEGFDLTVLNDLKNLWKSKIDAYGAVEPEPEKIINKKPQQMQTTLEEPLDVETLMDETENRVEKAYNPVQVPKEEQQQQTITLIQLKPRTAKAPQKVSVRYQTPRGPPMNIGKRIDDEEEEKRPSSPSTAAVHAVIDEFGQSSGGRAGRKAKKKGASTMPKRRSARQEALAEKRMKKEEIPQLDGGGPGMSDSSSEEEGDAADDSKEKEKEWEEGDDEKPLNSEDDQTDEEEADTVFEADNLVVCQFDKVYKVRKLWKLHLKEGIAHINGKDYYFHTCTGEAEW